MKVNNCRICGKAPLKSVLDYGEMALVDSFLSGPEAIRDEKKYPLTLCLCADCKHLQIDEVMDPGLLFGEYPWETGVSKSIIAFSRELCGNVLARRPRPAGAEKTRVLEVASNDGSILAEFKRNGCDILGVDPARNIVKTANERGIPSVAAFFNLQTARRIVEQHGAWDVCLARNVLAHVKDLHGLASGIKTVLDDDGFAVLEFPHVKKMFEELQYDQVFHEHLGYHSLDSVQRLFGMVGMDIFDVEEIWIHGGSLRVFLQHTGGSRKTGKNVGRLLKEERRLGLLEESTWTAFADRVLTHRQLLKRELEKAKSRGLSIAIYGASGKGQSLLQFCGIDKRLIDFVVDKSAMKQDRLTPGTHIPIFAPECIREKKPGLVLLCAWNFAKEVLEQEKEFISGGGRFLHPFPVPHIIP